MARQATTRWWRVAFCYLFLLSLAGCGRQAAPLDDQLVQGQPFPTFLLDSLGGQARASSPFNRKMLVLNVWATWCPPCRREMPGLDRLSKALDARRFAVIGMSTD